MAEISFLVRPAKSSDLHSALAVVAQLWPGVAVNLAAMERAFIEGLSDQRQRYWVAVRAECGAGVDSGEGVEGSEEVEEGGVVGFGSLSWGSTLWEAGFGVGILDELVVDESCRGKGVGDRLLAEIVAFARTQGLKAVQLTTAGHRVAAHQFYEQRGFKLKDIKVLRLDLQT